MQQLVLAKDAHELARTPVRVIDRTRLAPWEIGLILSATVLYWNDGLRLMFPGIDSTSIAFRAIHFLFYAAFAGLIGRDDAGLKQAVNQSPLLAACLLLPLLSVVWSIHPQESAQRGIAVLGSSLFGVYLAMRLKPLDCMRLIGKAATISAACSLILIMFFPAVGLMSEGEYVNVWSGAHMHKNGLGQMTALGAMICLIVLRSDGRNG